MKESYIYSFIASVLIFGTLIFNQERIENFTKGGLSPDGKRELAGKIEMSLDITDSEGRRNYLFEGDRFSAQLSGCALEIAHYLSESRACKGSVNPTGVLEERFTIDLRVVNDVEIMSDPRGFSVLFFYEDPERKALIQSPYSESLRSCDGSFIGPINHRHQPGISFPLDAVSKVDELLLNYIELHCSGAIGEDSNG